VLERSEDGISIKDLVPGLGAYRSGQLQPGDVLLSVDGRSVAGYDLDSVLTYIFFFHIFTLSFIQPYLGCSKSQLFAMCIHTPVSTMTNVSPVTFPGMPCFKFCCVPCNILISSARMNLISRSRP
jgi:hypothetical protein